MQQKIIDQHEHDARSSANIQAVIESQNKPSPIAEIHQWETAIADLRAQCGGLTITDAASYKGVKATKQKLVKLRTSVEARRAELVSDAVKMQRDVNAKAKIVQAAIVEIETPVVKMIQAWEWEQERPKREAREKAEREAAEKEQQRLAAIEAERLAKIEAEAARVKAEQEQRAAELAAQAEANRKEQERLEAIKVEQDRLAKIEADRIAAENARLQALRDAQEAEQRKLAAERAAIEAEKLAAAKAEADRLGKLKAETEARAAAEKAKEDAERKAREAEQAAARAKIDAENRRLAEQQAAVDAERKRLADEEAARLAKIEADRQEAERQAAEQQAKEAAKDDNTRLRDASNRLCVLVQEFGEIPLTTKKAKERLGFAMIQMTEAAEGLIDRTEEEQHAAAEQGGDDWPF
jgi:hypothetical protein